MTALVAGSRLTLALGWARLVANRRPQELVVTLANPPRAARLDPTWLDAEYHNRARHPEHVEIFARWQTERGGLNAPPTDGGPPPGAYERLDATADPARRVE